MRYLKKNKCLLLLSMGLLLSVLTGCIAIYTPRSGRVVEKGSGRPIQDAIIVRAWDKRFATVAGAMLSSVVLEETVSDDDGRFSFGPRILFSGIPILHWTEENPLLVFRPGYTSLALRKKAKVIELSALALNRYTRDTAAREARSHYLYDTTLLRKAVQQEEALIRELPEVTKGVMYSLHGLNDIAFDSRGNLFLSGSMEIVKLPKTGNNYETLSIGKTSISDQRETVEIEIFQNQLYALGLKKLSRIDVSATAGDASPLAPTTFVPGKGFVRKAVAVHARPPIKTHPVVTRRESINSSQPGGQQTSQKPGPVLGKPQPAPVEPKQASEEPGASPQNIPRPMREVLFEYSHRNALPNHDYRFAMGADGLIEVGTDSFKLNGEMIKRRTMDLSVLRYGSQYQVVETLYHDGYLVVALTIPSGSRFKNAIFIFNSENELVAVKKLPVQDPVQGLAAAGERYYACDAKSFYVFDHHFSLISSHTVPPELFGEFYLSRIKVDSGGENLFLIDRRYDRLLRYDLRNNDWR